MSAKLVEWEKSEGPHRTGSVGRRGGIKLFDVHIDNTRTEVAWCLYSLLPGYRQNFGPFRNENESRTEAEQMLIRWLATMNLQTL
jgi:hypothetical protein